MTDTDQRVDALSQQLSAAFGSRTTEVVQRMIADAEREQPNVAATWRRIAAAIERATPLADADR